MARNDISENFSEINSLIKNYFNARIDLIKLSLLQKITKSGTYLLTFVSIIVAAFAITIFLMFSFSFWYGENVGSIAAGFLISAGIYAVLLLILYLLRKVIFKRNLIKIFARIIFVDDEKN
jgi:hypothetical protein